MLRSRRLRPIVGFADRRPLLFVGLVALGARLVFAVASFLLNHVSLIPDEQQYLELGRAVSSGQSADEWYPGYGQSLYDAMRVFIVPIRFLFDIFGTSRLVAQLWPMVFGVATAVLTVRLAQRVLSPRQSLMAGLVVALLPSQILWSSVVLRESLVWAGLVLVTLAAVEASRGRLSRTIAWFAAAAFGLVALAYLREQTMVIAAWALPIGVLISSMDHRLRRTAGALVIAAAVPFVVGSGLFGYETIKAAVPALGRTRTNLAAGADSSFTGTTIATHPIITTTTIPTTTVPNAPSTSTTVPPPPTAGPGEVALTAPDGQVVVAPQPGPGEPEQIALNAPNGVVVVVDKPDIGANQTAIVGVNGRVYVVGEETFSSSFSNIPKGALATLLRPFIWESAHTLPLRFASVENTFWYVLYVLSGAGLLLGWRRVRWIAAVPVVTAAILVVAFVSQGNVGTAFRHRAQVLPLLAVLATVGMDELLKRRRSRATVPAVDEPIDDAPVDGVVAVS